MPSYRCHNFKVTIQYRFAARPRPSRILAPASMAEPEPPENDGERRHREHYAAMTDAISRRNPMGNENFGKLMSFCRQACRGVASEMRVDWKSGVIDMEMVALQGVDFDAVSDLVPLEIGELAAKHGLLPEAGLVTDMDAVPGAEFAQQLIAKLRAKLAGTVFAEPLEPEMDGLLFVDGLNATLRADLYPKTAEVLRTLYQEQGTTTVHHPSRGSVRGFVSSWKQELDGRTKVDRVELTFTEASGS